MFAWQKQPDSPRHPAQVWSCRLPQCQAESLQGTVTHVEERQRSNFGWGRECSTQHLTLKGQHWAAAGTPCGPLQWDKGGRQITGSSTAEMFLWQ